MALLKVLYHKLRGRDQLLQFYANINHSVSEECLKLHGKIFTSREKVPDPDCTYNVLRFPVDELDRYREKSDRMANLAREELRRRRLWREAKEALRAGRKEEGVELFREAGDIDLYLAELEEFMEEEGKDLSEGVREKLKKVFLRAYREKFAKDKYERQPELMRRQREEAGKRRIRELFSD